MTTLQSAGKLSSAECHEIDDFAIWALRTEVALYPKAGLVSFVDNGSHNDMTAQTFLQSANSLRGYFAEMAEAGAAGRGFSTLKSIGLSAEQRMFQATNGINTHRGAVFSLGLLAAAAGLCRTSRGSRTPPIICNTVERWGRPILASRPPLDSSHGSQVHRKYGAPGAREEAATGFPTIAFHTLPAFLNALEISKSIATAGLQAFYTAMSVLDDNNLLYRGGFAGLSDAQRWARQLLASGGMLAPDGFERALNVHQRCVARRLSPGGSADLLSATLFLAAEGRHIKP